jgi:adenylate cyclase
MSAQSPDDPAWTFAMIDLAGFTALTEIHGDSQAADLAIAFAELAANRLGPEDRLVKSIGDAVLLASPSPEAGVALVSAILEDCRTLPGFPVARAGLHHGPAAERDGDFFGAAVNLTARIAGQATGEQTLATATVAEAAAAAGKTIRSIGEVPLRNVAQRCELFEVELHPRTHRTVIDPVCRMRVEPDTAAAMLRHEDVEVWFCSFGCTASFLAGHAGHPPSA